MNILILLAAGNGSRMNTKTKKQFILIKNKPLFRYSFDTFYKSRIIDKYIIVINKNDYNNKTINNFKKEFDLLIKNEKLVFVYGGENRYDSVYNALDYIYNVYGDFNKKYVYIHDSARPFVSVSDIKNINKVISKYKCVSLACKVTDTIKTIKSNVSTNNLNVTKVSMTLNRKLLYSVMTPQVFEFDLLYKAHLMFKKQKSIKYVTDDLQLVELFTKNNTYLLDSNPLNVKITNKEDLNLYMNLF